MYRLYKEGKYCTMYAMVARDGSVLWYPTRQQGTELPLQRAQELANALGAEYGR